MMMKNRTNRAAPVPIHPLLVIALLTVLLLSPILTQPLLEVDTYSTMMSAPGTAWKDMVLRNGRVLTGLLYLVIEKLHLTFSEIYYLSYLSAAGFTILAAALVYSLLVQYTGRHSFTEILVCVITICNPLLIGFYQFLEVGAMCLSMFLAVSAAYLCRKLLSRPENRIRSILVTECVLLASCFLYQSTAALFVSVLLPFVISDFRRQKSAGKDAGKREGKSAGKCAAEESGSFSALLKQLAGIVFLWGIPMGINVVFTSVLFGSRKYADDAVNGSPFFERVLSFAIRHSSLLLLALAALAAGVLLFAGIIKLRYREEFRSLFPDLMGLLVLNVLVAFSPYMTGQVNYFPLRIYYALGASPGLAGIYLLLHLHETGAAAEGAAADRVRPGHLRAILLLSALLFLSTGIFFQAVFRDIIRVNAKDRADALLVLDRIRSYEERSGKTVDTISVYYDGALTENSRPRFFRKLNPSAENRAWSDVALINFYAASEGPKYIRGESDPSVQEYFSAQNWDTFHDAQLLFEGNEMYWCIY